MEQIKDLNVYLNDDVKDTSVQKVIEDINKRFDEQEKWLNEASNTSGIQMEKLEKLLMPVKLNITTFGGSIYDGLRLYDFLSSHKGKIECICEGYVMSAGTFIICAIPKELRYARKNTRFLIHSLMSITLGKLQDMEEDINESRLLMETIKSIYTENTNMTMKELDDIVKNKVNLFFGSEEAIKKGLISKII